MYFHVGNFIKLKISVLVNTETRVREKKLLSRQETHLHLFLPEKQHFVALVLCMVALLPIVLFFHCYANRVDTGNTLQGCKPFQGQS